MKARCNLTFNKFLYLIQSIFTKVLNVSQYHMSWSSECTCVDWHSNIYHRLPSSKEQAAMRLCPKALGGFAQTAEIHRGGSATCKSLPKHTCIRWQNNACTSLSNYTVTARYCSALTPRTQRVERVYLQATWWWPDWGRGVRVHHAAVTQSVPPLWVGVCAMLWEQGEPTNETTFNS